MEKAVGVLKSLNDRVDHHPCVFSRGDAELQQRGPPLSILSRSLLYPCVNPQYRAQRMSKPHAPNVAG